MGCVNDFITRTSFGAVQVPAEPGTSDNLVTDVTLPHAYSYYFGGGALKRDELHADARAQVPIVEGYRYIAVRYNGLASSQGGSLTIGHYGFILDTGLNSTSTYATLAEDYSETKNEVDPNPGASAPITSIFDHDRSGTLTSLDYSVVQQNFFATLYLFASAPA